MTGSSDRWITPEHFMEQKMVSGRRSGGKSTCPQGQYGLVPVSLCPDLLWASLHSSPLFLILTFLFSNHVYFSLLTSLIICLLFIIKYFQKHGFILISSDFYEVMDKSELIINDLVTNLCQIKQTLTQQSFPIMPSMFQTSSVCCCLFLKFFYKHSMSPLPFWYYF